MRTRMNSLFSRIRNHSGWGMDEVGALPYVVGARMPLLSQFPSLHMATPASREDVPTSLTPVPYPTHPVARQSVASDAPTFDWTPVPGAKAYRLQIGATDAFETIYYDDTVDGPTSLSLADLVPDEATTVVWRVRAETGEEAPWSGAAHFAVMGGAETGEGQFRVDAPPVPIHPITGDMLEARAAAFSWESVPQASGYQLQVGQTETIDDPIVNLTFDRTTSITLFDLLPEEQSPLYWRVRALFPIDTAGPWSQLTRFETGVDTAETDEVRVAEAASVESAEDPGEGSPMAAGPAQQAHTSQAMAAAFVVVLVVSFLITILLVMGRL